MYSIYSGLLWSALRILFLLTWLIPLIVGLFARRFSKQVGS